MASTEARCAARYGSTAFSNSNFGKLRGERQQHGERVGVIFKQTPEAPSDACLHLSLALQMGLIDEAAGGQRADIDVKVVFLRPPAVIAVFAKVCCKVVEDVFSIADSGLCCRMGGHSMPAFVVLQISAAEDFA
jgi:hypothetical protein